MLDDVQRGVAAGAVAGLAYAAYLAAVANPLVHYLEDVAAGAAGVGTHEQAGATGHEHEAAAHAHEHAGAVVSDLVATVASVGGGVLWGILLGAAFGAAFYLFEPALPGRGATKALVLGGAGFLAVSGVPWLALPPTVPGVEPALAAGPRLALYGALVVVGAALAAGSLLAYRRVAPQHGELAGALAASAPIVAVALVVPAATPVLVGTGEVPAELVVAFRGAVALSQLGLWAGIAGSFAWLRARTGGRRVAIDADATRAARSDLGAE